eukprot:CAMPEP_0178667972 /NCGR_PEP_ID=MMETSP0698-20121128/31335_1 /TAXON_ID=265572 /ORGANISM="Extubocellulus spinifer, Strain CCMP396" /LENGTH=63 /DNA_ID=CAMNT_0020311515 /DNA_START=202 /DNA_END=393 /DNA_ORIENTATION=+
MRTGETIGWNELLLPFAALSESLVPAASGPFAIMHLPRLGILLTRYKDAVTAVSGAGATNEAM